MLAVEILVLVGRLGEAARSDAMEGALSRHQRFSHASDVRIGREDQAAVFKRSKAHEFEAASSFYIQPSYQL